MRTSWYSLYIFCSSKIKSAPTEADALQNANSDRRQTIMMKHGMILPSSLEFAVLPNSYKGSMCHGNKKPVLPPWAHDCLAYSVYHKMGGFVKLNFFKKKSCENLYISNSIYVKLDRRQTIACTPYEKRTTNFSLSFSLSHKAGGPVFLPFRS